MFAPDANLILLGATLLAVVLFALALRQRSWGLWLAAFTVLVATLGVAWFARVTPTTG